MFRRHSSVIFLTLALSVSSCAGLIHSNIKSNGDLPKDLAPALKEKFEVHDLGQASPIAVSSPAPKVEKIVETVHVPKHLKSRKPRHFHRSHHRPVHRHVLKAHKKGHLTQHGKSKHGTKKKENAPSPASTPAFTYPNLRPAKDPIWVGEKLTYEVTYFGLPAGTFTLEALPYQEIDNRKVYHIKATARNSAIFGLVYKLKDYVETYIDYQGFYSHRFHLHQDETKQMRDSLELYDSEKGQSFWWNRWDRKDKGYSETKKFFPMKPFPQDTLSSLYYLRVVPLLPHTTVSFPVMSEGKPLTAYVKVIDRENMDTPMGMVRTIKVKPEAATRGVLERRGNSYMWLTDDDRRFLVRIEAKVKIGTVVAWLKKVELGTPPQ